MRRSTLLYLAQADTSLTRTRVEQAFGFAFVPRQAVPQPCDSWLFQTRIFEGPPLVRRALFSFGTECGGISQPQWPLRNHAAMARGSNLMRDPTRTDGIFPAQTHS